MRPAVPPLSNARGMSNAAAAACALARLVFATPAISKTSDKARKAGIWAVAAQPRPGLRPTIPTRYFFHCFSSNLQVTAVTFERLIPKVDPLEPATDAGRSRHTIWYLYDGSSFHGARHWNFRAVPDLQEPGPIAGSRARSPDRRCAIHRFAAPCGPRSERSPPNPSRACRRRVLCGGLPAHSAPQTPHRRAPRHTGCR